MTTRAYIVIKGDFDTENCKLTGAAFKTIKAANEFAKTLAYRVNDDMRKIAESAGINTFLRYDVEKAISLYGEKPITITDELNGQYYKVVELHMLD